MKILGGEGGNRLQHVLRSERGLTYGASADMDAYQRPGDIVADTDTRTETTVEALRLTVDEFIRAAARARERARAADAQAYLAGNFPLTIETPDAIATQVLNAIFYDLRSRSSPTYRERVHRVTPDDIQRVARQYLHPGRLSIVLVGDAAKFVPGPEGGRLRQVRAGRAGRARSHVGEPASAPDGGPGRAPGRAPPAHDARHDLLRGSVRRPLRRRARAELRRREPGIEIFGFGGPRLAAAGATSSTTIATTASPASPRR